MALLVAAAGGLAIGLVVGGPGEGESTPEPREPDRPHPVRPADIQAVGALLASVREDLGLPRVEIAGPVEITGPLEFAEGLVEGARAPLQGDPRFALARVRDGERITLRASPGGRPVSTVGDLTEFGSPRTMLITEIRGDWFGIPTPDLPNGDLAWVRDDRTKLDLYETPYWMAADLSSQQVVLGYGDQVLDVIPVGVGRPGSETPIGTYSVTDAFVGQKVGPFYGCCILALTGHQPSLPPGWLGGDRIAIHGTPGAVGGEVSAGCLRAGDRDMVSLISRVPLGAPVFIRA